MTEKYILYIEGEKESVDSFLIAVNKFFDDSGSSVKLTIHDGVI